MTPPPPGSRIEVVEAGERLVLRVPAGSPHARSLLIFAGLWNAIAWTAAGAFWAVGAANGIDWGLVPAQRNNGPMPWWVLLFTGLFPAIGSGLLVWWTRLKFTRTLIFAEPAPGGGGRVAVRTEWFGRERTRAADLAPGDRADLEVAWEENDVPRHRVRVGPQSGEKGAEKSRTVAFGAHLGEADVKWLAAAVNRAIGAEDPDAVGDELPNGPPVTVPAPATDDPHPHVAAGLDSRGRATVTVPIFPGWTAGKRVGVAFGVVFAVVWWTIIGFTVAGDLADLRWNRGGWDLVRLLFNLPFVLAGLAIVTGLIAVCRARVRTTIGEEVLSIRWGVGLLGYTRTVPLAKVEAVVIWKNFGSTTTSAGTRKDPAAAVRVAGAGADHLPLSVGGGDAVAAAVAGLVRARLEAVGWEPTPPDEPGPDERRDAEP